MDIATNKQISVTVLPPYTYLRQQKETCYEIQVEADGYTMHVDKQYVTESASYSAPSLPNIVITRDMWEGKERQATSPLRCCSDAPLSPLKFVYGQFVLISTLCLYSPIINYVLTILVFS
jgi:hypothetical protein